MKSMLASVAILAATLALATAAAAAAPTPGHPQLLLPPANGIVGVWEFQAHMFNCSSGQTIQRFRASSLFNAGGTMVDTNTAPPNTRGPGFGTWTYDLATRRYVVHMRLYRYDPTGAFIGVAEVRRVLAMSVDRKSSSGRFTGRILGPNEEVLATTCGEETGVRAL